MSTRFECPAGYTIRQLGEVVMHFRFFLVDREGRTIGKLYTIEPYAMLVTQPDGLTGTTSCLYQGALRLLATVSNGRDGPSTYLPGGNSLALHDRTLNRSLLVACPSEISWEGTASWSPAQLLQ